MSILSVTIHDVAREANVSISTVSRVLNGRARVNRETRSRVLEVMDRLGYYPNLAARNLVRKNAETIGLIIPHLSGSVFMDPFFPEVLSGIEEVVNEAGYRMLIVTNREKLRQENIYVRMFREGSIDGLILMNTSEDDENILALEETDYPFVLIGRFPRGNKINYVDCDNKRGAYEATEHLIKHGHEKIAFINTLPNLASSSDRAEGYRQALQRHQIKERAEFMRVADHTIQGGLMAMKELLGLPQRPTAVFAGNMLMAYGAFRAITESGLQVPDDIALMGYDLCAFEPILNVKISTFKQPVAEMGRVAARMLFDLILKKEPVQTQVIMRSEFVPGTSCGCR